jgi:hypothetical protein
MNSIKALPGLATNQLNTHCALGTDGVKDMNAVINAETNVSSAISSNNFTKDITAPTLEHYVMDMDSYGEESILFSFSETVNASSLTADTFGFILSQENMDVEEVAVKYFLTGGNIEGMQIETEKIVP